MFSLFSFQKKTLNILELNSFMYNVDSGGFVFFEGRVRNRNKCKDVAYLEYEACESLSKKEFEKIVNETKKIYNIKKIYCVHRLGKLGLGDVAILLGVSAVHRGEAFSACEYAISELKQRLPIWKKEIYINNDYIWVDECNGCNILGKDKENIFYYRQNKLKVLREGGQLNLKNAKILVIGAGGLGSSALQYLAASGIGKIGICDGDKIELSNLHRQTIFKFKDCGKSKAKIASSFIKEFNPFIKVCTYNEYINSKNGKLLFGDYNLVLDCTDNFNSKFLINDLGYLTKTPIVRSSIYQFEGQIEFFEPSISPCLRCLWPKIPDKNIIGSCAEVGVLGVVPGLLGIYQANEAIKYFLGLEILKNNEIMLIDLLSNQSSRLKRQKNKNCILCGKNPIIIDICKENYKETTEYFEEDLISISGIYKLKQQ